MEETILEWRKETPKKDGFYWIRTNEIECPKVIKVKDNIVKTGPWIFEISDIKKAEFLGPL